MNTSEPKNALCGYITQAGHRREFPTNAMKSQFSSFNTGVILFLLHFFTCKIKQKSRKTVTWTFEIHICWFTSLKKTRFTHICHDAQPRRWHSYFLLQQCGFLCHNSISSLLSRQWIRNWSFTLTVKRTFYCNVTENKCGAIYFVWHLNAPAQCIKMHLCCSTLQHTCVKHLCVVVCCIEKNAACLVLVHYKA